MAFSEELQKAQLTHCKTLTAMLMQSIRNDWNDIRYRARLIDDLFERMNQLEPGIVTDEEYNCLAEAHEDGRSLRDGSKFYNSFEVEPAELKSVCPEAYETVFAATNEDEY